MARADVARARERQAVVLVRPDGELWACDDEASRLTDGRWGRWADVFEDDSALRAASGSGAFEGRLAARTPGGERFDADVRVTALHGSEPLLAAIVTRLAPAAGGGCPVAARPAGGTDSLARQQADAKFRALLETAPDAMVIVDRTGRMVIVNGQAERLFGYGRDEMLGRPIELLIPSRYRATHPAQRDRFFAEPRLRPMGMGMELFAQRKDGSEFPVEVSLSPLETEDGLLVSSSIRDVTERRLIERALSDKNVELQAAIQAKDLFLASMSHELRTPLNAIIGFTGTLLMRLPGPITPAQEKQLRTVQSSAKHLLSLINDILDLAKIESGRVELHPEPVDVRDIVHEVTQALAPQAESRSLSLEALLPERDLVIQTDRRSLHQILLNLASNAVKFTTQGGVVIVVERDDEPPRRTRISVTDTGIGISREGVERLFQPFTQVDATGRRGDGTGLGLHLSRKLAVLMGGEITCTSELGRGSTFTLTLTEA